MTRVWLYGLAAGLAIGGCVSETTGHEQSLQLSLEGALPEAVATATVVVAAAELHPCSWTQGAGTRSVLAQVAEWWLPTAHAHSESSALRIGEPQVIALHAGRGARVSLGRFYAPEGRYCDIGLELAPADEDANGADGGALDTLYVTYDDDREPLYSAGRRSFNVPLAAPLVVEGAPVRQTLTLRVSLDSWPIANGMDGAQALSVLTRTFSSL